MEVNEYNPDRSILKRITICNYRASNFSQSRYAASLIIMIVERSEWERKMIIIIIIVLKSG